MINGWVVLAVMFSLLSSVRFVFLPELQLFVMFILLLHVKNNRVILLYLVAVLCTSTYAIPDIVYRAVPDVYPSIYTKSIFFSIKAIDIVSVCLFVYSLPFVLRLFEIKGIAFLFILLGISLFATVINSLVGVSNYIYALFYFRSFMMAVGFFGIVSSLGVKDVSDSLFFSMLCWILKMMAMILFPSDNVISREIFGFDWKIFFAGDEYLSFGVICACLICLNGKLFPQGHVELKRIGHRCVKYCFFAFALAIISQRKGSIPYFFVVFLVIYVSALINRSTFSSVVTNSMVMISASFFMILFFFVYDLLPDIYQLAVNEYYVLYVSAMRSVASMFSDNPLSAALGIGVAGLYKIQMLPDWADHIFSFGSEVGNLYRYAIWNMPLGRLIINAGFFGGALVFFMLIGKIIYTPAKFYLLFSLVPFFAMYGVTPVSSIYVGYTLGTFYLMSRVCKRDTGGGRDIF